MKLHLGAGNDIRTGYINHDLVKHRPEIDIAFDLERDWPSTYIGLVEEIIAFDVVEHLDDVVAFMNRCWDCLMVNGVLYMKACGWRNPNVHVDPTHKRGFDIDSFDYFDPETDLGKQYGFYTDKRWQIIEKHYDRKQNVIIELKPRK
ncbi:MAG: hypothetical protein U1E54_03825 [Candidatus Levybacteria bacterium]|nr:hypothetical protein [Candidatus Levybacteria bacterium]